MTNENKPEFNTGIVAQWVHSHENTIRDWAKRFSGFLSPSANAGKRRFTYEDVRVIATVAEARNAGLTLDDIEEKILKQGKLLENDKMPLMPDPDIQDAQRKVDILKIPKEQFDLQLLEIEIKQQMNTLRDEKERLEKQLADTTARLETELKETTSERDQLRTQVIVLERDIAAAQERLKIIEQERKPFTWWLRWILMAIIVIAVTSIVLVIVVYFISTLSLGAA